VAGRDYLIERFLNALETEIGWLDQVYEIETLFLGGGTPSHLSAAQMERLGSIIRSRFVLNQRSEFTAECNPNDLDEACSQALATLGVNRISLGVQSLNPAKLQRLERDHGLADIQNAIELARQFATSVSFDLIFAAPQETLSEWDEDLESATELQPDHLSTYELTYEKGTHFWNRLSRGDLAQSDEDLRAEMYTLAIEKLQRSGLRQYEVSSFARSGHACRHNQAYWIGDPYFAFGPGAARFIDGIRETNHQSTMKYLQLVESGQPPVAEREQLAPRAAAAERLAVGLRLNGGLNPVEFKTRTGFSIAEIFGDLRESLIENGLLTQAESTGNWLLTHRGLMVCDWIAGEIVSAE
jgi:oxygen-independent coproporphyrinogen-3 oxidase